MLDNAASCAKVNLQVNEECLNLESINNYVISMCLNLLDQLDSGTINENFGLSRTTLQRGTKGVKLDDKTIRTIACIYHKTEDFNQLKNVIPEFMHEILDRANNKLSRMSVAPYEISSNPEFIKMWNLCHGQGCSLDLAKKYFGEKSITIINILETNKLITKSILNENTWITSADIATGKSDLIKHYSQMSKIATNCLSNSDSGLGIQFTGNMSDEDFEICKIELKEVVLKHVRTSALKDVQKNSKKFNFQLSFVDLNTFTNGEK